MYSFGNNYNFGNKVPGNVLLIYSGSVVSGFCVPEQSIIPVTFDDISACFTPKS